MDIVGVMKRYYQNVPLFNEKGHNCIRAKRLRHETKSHSLHLIVIEIKHGKVF